MESATLELNQEATKSSPIDFQRLVEYVVIFLILGGVGWIRFRFELPMGITPDEKTYIAQANTLVTSGLFQGLDQLITDYLKVPKNSGYPPPTRLGTYAPIALVMRILNNQSLKSGIYLSLFCSIATVTLTSLFIFQRIGFLSTVLALSLMAWNMVDICISRRAWGDSLFGLFATFAFLGTVKFGLKERISLLPLLLFAVVTGFLVWIKEAGLPFVLFTFFLIVLIRGVFLRDKAGAITVGVFGSISLLAHYCILIGTVGGFPIFLRIYSGLKHAHLTNKYLLDFQTGTSYSIAQMLFIATPVTAFGLLVGIMFFGRELMQNPALLRKESTAQIFAIALIFILFQFLLMWLSPGLMNMRYFSAILTPLFIVASYPALIFEKYCGRLPKVERIYFLTFAALLLAIAIRLEKNRTDNILLKLRVPDPSLGYILGGF